MNKPKNSDPANMFILWSVIISAILLVYMSSYRLIIFTACAVIEAYN